MKRLYLALMFSCLSTLPFSQVQANTTTIASPSAKIVPTQASLQKLVQVMQVETTFSNMTERSNMMVDETLKQAFNSQLQDDSLTTAQKDQIRAIIADFAKKMLAEQNTPAMRQQFINAYMQTAQDTYDQAEVNAMISFYGSPVGQSVATKQTEFSTVYMQKIMPIVFENQQKTLQKYLPDMQKQLEQIISNKPSNTKKVNKR